MWKLESPVILCSPGKIASMEPQQFSCGNRPEGRSLRQALQASMEPQQFSCGNVTVLIVQPDTSCCFNGATTIQLWKRRHLQPAHYPNCRRFNGATTIQLWKPSVCEPVDPDESGFNGATTIQLWKPIAALSVVKNKVVASMEPQQFSCGNPTALAWGSSHKEASMEPQQFSCGNSDRKKSHCGDVANGLFSRTK